MILEQKPINSQQLKAFNCLIHKLNLTEHKATMVEGATQGRATSSKDLSFDEARDLIKQLNEMAERADGNSEAITKMRGKIMYYARQMGWEKKNLQGRTVADVSRIDAWCIAFSYKKKKMNFYKYAELPKLVSQFAEVYKHFLKSI